MKYGIKHIGGQIEAISRFDIEESEKIPDDFTEITEESYLSMIEKISTHANVFYSEEKQDLVVDADAEYSDNEAKELLKKRDELRRLSIELDLMARLGEATEEAQIEFDELKRIYQGGE